MGGKLLSYVFGTGGCPQAFSHVMGLWPAVAGVWPGCSLWVPAGYAQCLSSAHAPGCLEATLGHAKFDLIYSASQQGLSSWPHSHSTHDLNSWKELCCVEPAGPASALNSYWPAEGCVKILSKTPAACRFTWCFFLFKSPAQRRLFFSLPNFI